MQLERILHSQGFGTRRTCRERIRAGQVQVDGAPCLDPHAEFSTEALDFAVDGETWRYRQHAYLALNKPAGYECSHRPLHHPSVFSLLPQPLVTRGVQCVGRLDEDTTGLLLLTDDGPFLHALSSPRRKIAKVYEVRTRHAVDDAQIAALLHGVTLHDEPAPVCAAACERLDGTALRLTITEGKYHQVKRMIAASGNRVEALRRVAIGGLELPAGVEEGQWIWLDAAALARLRA
jgi:16S rRNA pseudouridine516 synthase